MIICERFHLSPIELRQERFKEFLLLAERMIRHNQIEKSKYKRVKTKDGYKYVRKVYANDNERI